jgi:hypothetical protein
VSEVAEEGPKKEGEGGKKQEPKQKKEAIPKGNGTKEEKNEEGKRQGP